MSQPYAPQGRALFVRWSKPDSEQQAGITWLTGRGFGQAWLPTTGDSGDAGLAGVATGSVPASPDKAGSDPRSAAATSPAPAAAAPAVAQNDAFSTDEASAVAGHNLFDDNGSGPDNDPDGPPLSVESVNGSSANVGGQFLLPSGARLTVIADGSFDYSPNGAFNATPTAGSGASNQPAHDSFTYTLAGGGSATVTITIQGLDSNDLLLGTAGVDTLTGGVGNDQYVIANSGDVVVEASGGGQDIVSTLVDYQLAVGSHVERLTSVSWALTTPLQLTGNEFVNLIEGNAGHNLLDGRGGADKMVGFGGDDVYVIDHADDLVVENSGQGLDTAYTLVDYQLREGAHVETLSAISWAATDPLVLTGNSFVNTLYGNAGNNVLNGGGGADTLVGFGGNDKYVVDNAGDVVIEASGGGYDGVSAAVDYTLAIGSHVERLSAVSVVLTTPLKLTGNNFVNLIEGNAGDNQLNGGGGADTLVGFGGNDKFVVDNAGDVVVEASGGGTDSISAAVDYTLAMGSHVERLNAISFALTTPLELTGNELANRIEGNAGNNRLDGKGGADTLVGFGGADTYAFTTMLGGGNIDTIVSFELGVDKIHLESAIFGGLTQAAMTGGALVIGSAAQDAGDRIIYNPTSGALLFDKDGTGAAGAIQFATLQAGLAITSADFLVPPAFLAPSLIGSSPGMIGLGDFNNDGLDEPFGYLNNGDGTFNDDPLILSINPILANYPGRAHRDVRAFDIDGDGNLDAILNVYSDASIADSFALILYGDGAGGFSSYDERPDIDGFGETIVTADFNNDGRSDAFLPVYTHVLGSDSSYFLLNEGGVLGVNRAEEWGVNLPAQPFDFRVEGAQAADVNFDGFIDFFTASHLFINDGTKFTANTLNPFVFDEGANLFDYDNDGDFDLVLRARNGEQFSPRLFTWDGAAFVDSGFLDNGQINDGLGIQVFDVDANGWVDVVYGGVSGLTIHFNHEGVFTQSTMAIGVSYPKHLAFFDYDKDGAADLLAVPSGQLYLFENNLAQGDSISLSVVGPAGELDQHGRSILLVSEQDPSIRMARVVDSGSGYMSQNQYELLIGLPVAGAYGVEIPFATGTLAFTAAAGQQVVAFADGRVNIVATAGDDVLGGGSGLDNLVAGSGDDTIIGSTGADVINAGDGDDRIDFSRLSVGVTVDLAAGSAQVGSDTQTVLNAEHVVGSAFADVLLGNDRDNILTGGNGGDLLDGSGGADILAGGLGNDIYVVDASDSFAEAASAGIDEVRTARATFTLPANFENLTGLSGQSQELIGNDLANLIAGGAGADILRGGLGNDIYVVGAGDAVVEADGAGIDEARTALVSYGLTAHVENLTGLSGGGQELIGNGLGNLIAGGAGADTLRGGLGNDIYVVGAGDVVVEADGAGIDEARTALVSYGLTAHVENLTGLSSGGQELIGNGLGNLIVGGAGADTMRGGLGNDIYKAGNGDLIVESASQGTDEVITSLLIYTLPANVEKLTGFGTLSQKLIGNDLNNTMTSAGAFSTLIGLGGDDLYHVTTGSENVIEASGQGMDIVRTLVSYRLPVNSHVEVLEAANPSATTAIELRGNNLDNLITGNAGSNLFFGGGGVDQMVGLGGDDQYVVDVSNYAVIEASGGGFDIVSTVVDYQLVAGSHVERLTSLSWAMTTPLKLTGNEFANLIEANAGNNQLDGKLGADTLVGFGGADTFAFTSALGGGNVDAVADFVAGTDKIALDDAIFAAIGAALDVAEFRTGAAAADADDRIVYNSATGQLFYDSDGVGGVSEVQFATLQSGLAITVSDFLVI